MSDKPDYTLRLISLAQITGLDPVIEAFLGEHGFETDIGVDFDCWDPDAQKWIYLNSPMIVAERKDGYEVIGTGRAWRLAQELFHPDEEVPVLVLASRRLNEKTKLQIVGAELFGLSAKHRTRPHLPKRMFALWQAINKKGAPTILGEDVKDFSRGTGYSLRALLTNGENAKGEVDSPSDEELAALMRTQMRTEESS